MKGASDADCSLRFSVMVGVGQGILLRRRFAEAIGLESEAGEYGCYFIVEFLLGIRFSGMLAHIRMCKRNSLFLADFCG